MLWTVWEVADAVLRCPESSWWKATAAGLDMQTDRFVIRRNLPPFFTFRSSGINGGACVWCNRRTLDGVPNARGPAALRTCVGQAGKPMLPDVW